MAFRLSLCVGALSLCVVAPGAEPPRLPSVPPPPPAPLPHPVNDSLPSAAQQREARELSPLEHLRRAAEHLEAVGWEDEASRLRERAEAEETKATERLRELREQLAEVQEQIRELEALTGFQQQIALECRIIEVSLAKLAGLNLCWETAQCAEEEGGGTKTLDAKSLQSPRLIRSEFADALVDQLCSAGLARQIARPTIVTTSGRPATLLSGGEFPIPVPAAGDPQRCTMEWREFGTRMEAVCQSLGSGRVRIEVAPEVSERDFSRAVTVSGIKVPGLTSRRLNVQLEMSFGQTLLVGVQGADDQTPEVIRKIPQTERLFQSGEGERETAVLFLVTPSAVGEAE